jgi:hypothetical protein
MSLIFDSSPEKRIKHKIRILYRICAAEVSERYLRCRYAYFSSMSCRGVVRGRAEPPEADTCVDGTIAHLTICRRALSWVGAPHHTLEDRLATTCGGVKTSHSLAQPIHFEMYLILKDIK